MRKTSAAFATEGFAEHQRLQKLWVEGSEFPLQDIGLQTAIQNAMIGLGRYGLLRRSAISLSTMVHGSKLIITKSVFRALIQKR